MQIGRHFSKEPGVKVVDVVMMKDVGPLINLAATATNLEQQRKAEAEKALKKGPKGGPHQLPSAVYEAFMQPAGSLRSALPTTCRHNTTLQADTSLHPTCWRQCTIFCVFMQPWQHMSARSRRWRRT